MSIGIHELCGIRFHCQNKPFDLEEVTKLNLARDEWSSSNLVHFKDNDAQSINNQSNQGTLVISYLSVKRMLPSVASVGMITLSIKVFAYNSSCVWREWFSIFSAQCFPTRKAYDKCVNVTCGR